jgi:hypothetical protein
MQLISLPGPSDLRQVARWHDEQAVRKKRGKLKHEAARHVRVAEELRAKASKTEQQ